MLEFLLEPGSAQNVGMIILLLGAVTYVTRSIGYFVLARFDSLHPRLEAALEAVPASVLVTLVLPQAVSSGPLEVFALFVALVASLRLHAMLVLSIGMAVVVVGRFLGL